MTTLTYLNAEHKRIAVTLVSAAFALLPSVCQAAPPIGAMGRDTSTVAATSTETQKLTVAVHPISGANGTIGTAYDVAELAVAVSGGESPYTNPFDPDTVAVDAHFSGPGGRHLSVPAFWTAPYRVQNGDVILTPGAAGWRLRVAPTAPGSWTVTVTVRDRSGVATSAPVRFRVAQAPAGSHGFVGRATGAGRARYFQCSDGAPYFPIGENVCWSDQRGLNAYVDWFGKLGSAGGNYARIWMEPRAIENATSGPGRYDLKNAAYFDQVLSLAGQHGIRCMLAFGTYGELKTGGYFNEGKWPVNPYNHANGGPVPEETPDAIFTNPAARKLYRNRLRYLVARYGAYTSLAFWEFWNERGAPADWFAEMAAYLKQTDAYAHPITNSYSSTGPADVWNIPQMDLTQTHSYGDEGSMLDIAPNLPVDAQSHARYAKPHLMGEFGITWRGPDSKFDEKGTGANIHNGIWASAMSGDAGSAMVWWWDNYVAPKNLYGTFTGLSRFARAIDWPRRAFEPIDLPVPTLGSGAQSTTHDLVLSPAPAWGAKAGAPVVIAADGQTQGQNRLIGYLYGPAKSDLRSTVAMDITLHHPAILRLRIGTVSDKCEVQVAIDGKPAASWALDPTEAGAGTYKETKYLSEYKIYQARFDAARELAIPAGAHHVTIANVAGDWVGVTSYEIAGAFTSRFSPLRTIALQDRRSGETIVWLQDPQSNWSSDRDGKIPADWRNVALAIPVPRPGAYRVQWWDTRTGNVVGDAVAASSGDANLAITAPEFRRDIALRIVKN